MLTLRTYPDAIRASSKVAHYLPTLGIENVVEPGGVYWCHDTHGPDMGHANRWNIGCYDVSKSRVQAEHLKAFGYPLHVDPLTYSGSCVEKSDLQYQHDGRLVECPIMPKAEKVYQLYLNWRIEYRVFVHWGVDFVMVKKKSKPWGWEADRVEFAEPDEVFRAEDIDRLNRFCWSFGMDFGELDVLTDDNGKPYIIDVNNISGNGSKVLDQFPDAEERYKKAVLRLCN